MALIITDSCINCGYCEKECPNQAIYEPGMQWTMGDGTRLRGMFHLNNGKQVKAGEMQPPLSDQFYYIVPEKCSECKGIYDKPQCRVVCPDPSSFKLHPSNEKITNLIFKQYRLNP